MSNKNTRQIRYAITFRLTVQKYKKLQSATIMQPQTRIPHRLIGRLMKRRDLLLFVNMLPTGVRQGLKRKWPAMSVFRIPPGPLKRGRLPSAVACICRPLRKARRRGGL